MPTPAISMEYPDAVYEYDAERELAISVITLALKDYVRAVSGLMVGKIKRTARNSLELVRDECFSFLTGKTEIARHWFHQAGARFFTATEIVNAKNIDDSGILTGQSWTREPKVVEDVVHPKQQVSMFIEKNIAKIGKVKPKLRAGYILKEVNKHMGKPISEMTVRRAMKGLC
jgi:hypothetical protein